MPIQENTIFQSPQKEEIEPFPLPKSHPVGVGGVAQNAQNIQQSPVNPPVAAPSPPPPDYGGGFPTPLKMILGVIVVAVFIFLIVHFVVPLFKSNNQKVTLAYWGLWEDSGVVKSTIADFEKKNPTITVEYTKEDVKGYRERLTTRLQNGTGPDVFRFHNSWLPMFSSTLLPLPSDVIGKKDFEQSFYPTTQSDLEKNGAIYGIPLEIDTLSLFVNSDMLSAQGLQPPTTWEEFLADARKLTVPDETNTRIKTSGAALGTFDNITHAPDILSLLLAQNGANLTNLSATPINAADAFNFYISFATGDSKVWDTTLDPSLLAFEKGNLAMYFGYSWDVFAIKAVSPDLKFQVVPVPHLPNRNMTIASYWAEGVSVKSKHTKEALLFMKFLAEKDTEQKFFSEISKTRLFGEPYARVDLADSLKDNTLAYPFVSQAKTAVSSYFVGDTFDNGLNSQLNSYLGNAVRSMLANTSAQTAIGTLSQGATQVLRQYGQ